MEKLHVADGNIQRVRGRPDVAGGRRDTKYDTS
jgi:hypothetical protein